MTKERLAQYRFIANRISASEVEQLCNEIERLEAACREKDELIQKQFSESLKDAKRIAELEATVKRLQKLQDGNTVTCPSDHASFNGRTVDDMRHQLRLADGEIERLKKELTETKWELKSSCQALQDEQNENQKMAELLDQAPHDVRCGSYDDANDCNCWKKGADALL